MAGDYFLYQRRYGNLTTDVQLTTLTTSYPSVMVPRNVNYQVYLQKAYLMVTTYTAVTVKLVGHTSGNVYAEWVIPAAPPTSDSEDVARVVDYGPAGLSLIQVGENLDVTVSGTGLAAFLHLEGYQKLAKVIGAYSPDNAAGTAGLQ